ncbi:MAG: glycosyltransferase, partial [Blastocatellia bacterium]|nr:glycosyltransferase [Blastocatellia bacterium]
MAKNISVIIPTYNRLVALAELIECLYQQSYQNFEVIIVNDAGQSIEIIKNLYPELH